MGTPAEQIDAAFVRLAARVAGGEELSRVTVHSINPTSGATLATAENVTALKRARRRMPVGAQGGEFGSDLGRFVLRASEIPFTLKQRDHIVDADGVTIWFVDKLEVIAFGQLITADVKRKR